MKQQELFARLALPRQSRDAAEALRSATRGRRLVWLLSAVLALFPLLTMLFILVVFDVAVPGHHGATVLGLLVVMLVLAVFQSVFAILRRRVVLQTGALVLTGVAERLDEAATASAALNADRPTIIARDIDAIRAFLSGPAVIAVLDLAVVPVALVAMLVLHVAFGGIAAIALGLIAVLLWRGLGVARAAATQTEQAQARREAAIGSVSDAPDLVRALGIHARANAVWQTLNIVLLRADQDHGESAERLQIAAVALRQIALVGTLTAGAALAIADRASLGVVFAAAWLIWVMLSRLIAVSDHATALVAARRGWRRIDDALAALPERAQPLALPRPTTTLDVEGVAFGAPGMKRPLVHGVSFSMSAGQVLAVLGPAAAGKSALLRVLAGYWPVAIGKVRLDGAALEQFGPETLARHVGYLPQTVDLFDGTVAENIARFDPEAHADQVIAAAKAAGAHDMIVRLPDGYSTRVGRGGDWLSASQAQRIGLARALYGAPFLIVLDEPTSGLDPIGEKLFIDAVKAARARGAIVVLAGNANTLVTLASHVLILQQGTMSDFGERDSVRQRVAQRRRSAELAASGKADSDSEEAAPATAAQD